MGAARSAMGLGGGAGSPGLLRTVGSGAMRFSIPTTIGAVSGNMVDESSLLGGSESAANDTVGKALKWGGLGAGIGTLIAPGAGTAIGAGLGGLVGVGHEFLERQGVLDAPTIQDTVDETIHTADRRARELGVPEQVINALKQNYRANAKFTDSNDKTARTTLADNYAALLQEEAVAYATDPAAYMNANQGMDPEADTRRQLAMQALLVNTVKPYADQFVSQSEATAQSLENMAAGAGDLAPMYLQQAAQQRQMGTMYAGNLVQSAQITPYQQAAEQQAQYLKQIANQTMSSAIGQVMSPQSNAGSTDLTAIIDQYANAAQPQ